MYSRIGFCIEVKTSKFACKSAYSCPSWFIKSSLSILIYSRALSLSSSWLRKKSVPLCQGEIFNCGVKGSWELSSSKVWPPPMEGIFPKSPCFQLLLCLKFFSLISWRWSSCSMRLMFEWVSEEAANGLLCLLMLPLPLWSLECFDALLYSSLWTLPPLKPLMCDWLPLRFLSLGFYEKDVPFY